MADSVSKLYAEIGFKVNQDGLKQAQEVLKSLAAQMTAINNATKNAAREYGIFSKDRAKQALADEKLATQRAKTEREINKKRIDDERLNLKKESQARKERLDDEKRVANESASIRRQELRDREKHFKAREKLYSVVSWGGKNLLKNTKRMWEYGVGSTIGDAMANALESSIPIRDLMLQTGIGFSGTQNISRRFANIGINAPQEEIYRNLREVQQRIVNIGLGEKGGTTPYKLLGLAAQRGDMLGMVTELGKAIKDLRNPEALNLLNRIGLDEKWLSYFRLQERGGGLRNRLSREGLDSLVEAETALTQLRYGFAETARIITAKLEPALSHTSDALLAAFDAVIDEFIKNPEITKAFKELGDSLAGFVKGINWEELPKSIESTISSLKDGALSFLNIITAAAKLFGLDPDSRLKENALRKWVDKEGGDLKIRFKRLNENEDWFNRREGESSADYERRLNTMNPYTEAFSMVTKEVIENFKRPKSNGASNYTTNVNTNIYGVEQNNIPNVAGAVTSEATTTPLSRWGINEVRVGNAVAYNSGKQVTAYQG